MLRNKLGFTLVEILTVLAIVSLLSAFGFASFNEARKSSRDTERKADLRALQSAIELYKQKNGRFPAGCNAAGTWSGQLGTTYACSNGTGQYIVGLAPEFIPVLPIDPRLNGADSGYVYVTNTAGTVFKLMAKNTSESEVVTFAHEFSSCDRLYSGVGICDGVHPSGSPPNHCYENLVPFQTTYAVWGGYAVSTSLIFVERLTEDIICEIP